MECTVDPCHSPLVYKGGENIEDYGCQNPNCKRFEIQYYGNVKVRSNHYFLMGYNLPYTWIDRRTTYGWFALVGSPESGKTELQGLKLVERSYGGHNWNEATQDYSAATISECVQEVLHTMEYVALPANQDFRARYNELRDRVMNEWLSNNQLTLAQQIVDHEDNYDTTIDNLIWAGDDTSLWGAAHRNSSRRQLAELNAPREQSASTPISPLTINITDNLRQLINTATTDTNDDAAETAALRACRELRRLLNG